MHKNPFWLFFLTLFTLITAYKLTTTGQKISLYYALKEKTIPYSMRFDLISYQTKFIPFSEKRFSYKGNFTYKVKNKHFSHTFLLSDISFLDENAAKQYIEQLKKRPWVIWYCPENPKVSSLTKAFPLKEVAYSIILLSLWGYFIGLGFYVGTLNKK